MAGRTTKKRARRGAAWARAGHKAGKHNLGQFGRSKAMSKAHSGSLLKKMGF